MHVVLMTMAWPSKEQLKEDQEMAQPVVEEEVVQDKVVGDELLEDVDCLAIDGQVGDRDVLEDNKFEEEGVVHKTAHCKLNEEDILDGEAWQDDLLESWNILQESKNRRGEQHWQHILTLVLDYLACWHDSEEDILLEDIVGLEGIDLHLGLLDSLIDWKLHCL